MKHRPQPSNLRRMALRCLSAAITIAMTSGCVGPDGQPLGGVSLKNQYRVAGTATGAGAGFGVARALDLDNDATRLVTALGGGLGWLAGNIAGQGVQRRYDQNMARDAEVSRRIVNAESALRHARAENSRLRGVVSSLRHASGAYAATRAREGTRAGQQLHAQMQADLAYIEEARTRARNLGLHGEYAKLTQQRDQLAAQNQSLRETLNQLRASERRISQL